MKKDIYINCINKNWLSSFFKNKKEFYVDLKKFLESKLGVEIRTIYFFSDRVILRNKTVLVEYENIKFIVTKSFNYVLKHLALKGIFTKESIVLTLNVWDYYLVSLGITVYGLKYKNLQEDFGKITEKDLRAKILDLDLSQYTDYLVLQVKNDDSIGQGKTISLLKKYKSVETLLETINESKDERLKGIIRYQLNKLNYYLYLKSFFLTEEDLLPKK